MPVAQHGAAVALGKRRLTGGIEPAHDLVQLGELQRFGTLFLGGVQRLDAAEHLAHHWRLGRVGEALLEMPLRQGGQALPQRVDRQRLGMVGQVARDAVGGRR
ncbi:hypothetical protein [Cupriavidus sp. AcVe19-6a]|uniref:hypothetical protein n=1 Tax=Cupriavidus sp. AcVe19-6a TaxID=2821358 RepID=UPI001AE6CEC0|nr:hypothetical protein [Cupriavidus sp. AcVe19-6a]MBP0639459.1 hypothetical protein [Cupriavidus sp. AcVe19-6a]